MLDTYSNVKLLTLQILSVGDNIFLDPKEAGSAQRSIKSCGGKEKGRMWRWEERESQEGGSSSPPSSLLVVGLHRHPRHAILTHLIPVLPLCVCVNQYLSLFSLFLSCNFLKNFQFSRMVQERKKKGPRHRSPAVR